MGGKPCKVEIENYDLSQKYKSENDFKTYQEWINFVGLFEKKIKSIQNQDLIIISGNQLEDLIKYGDKVILSDIFDNPKFIMIGEMVYEMNYKS
jgi:hypothetical protein